MWTSWISLLFSFCYSIPSVALYGITIYTILRCRKTFDSSFFNLFVYDGFMNLFTYFVGLFMLRLTSITCFDCLMVPVYMFFDNNFPMNFFTAMSYHMAYVQYSTTALISVNRLSVLWNYKTFEPIWRKFTWFIMFVVFAFPFADTHRCFKYSTKVTYDSESDSYSFATEMPIPDTFIYLIPFMVVVSVSSVLVNVTSFVSLRHLKTQKRGKVEKNFISIMAITCAVQLLGCVLSVARVYFSANRIAATLASFLPFVSDGLTLVQPWLLVVFSSTMRRRIKQVLGYQQGSQGTFVIVRSVTN